MSETKRRKKGQGSIRQKPNGTFAGRISISGYEPYSCVGSTKKEVEKKLEAFRISTLKNEVVPQKTMVRDYIETWLSDVKRPSLKPASYDRLERTYQDHIKNSPVGRCQIGNIKTMDIQKLINEKSEFLSYSSLKKIYELLSACFNHAVEVRDMNFNPVKAVCMPKRENLAKQTKSIEVFSMEELRRLEEVARITYKTGEPRYRHTNLFILLANTGLRAGEALALTWENVDMERQLIYVRQSVSTVKDRDKGARKKNKVIITTVKTKTGNRTVPCNEKAMEALRWMKQYQEMHNIHSRYVDCNDKGETLRQQTLPKILKAILEAAEIPYKNVHSFRHTFATNLIEAGVDVKVVSQLLGHSSVKITYDTYVHPQLNHAVEAVNLLDSKVKNI